MRYPVKIDPLQTWATWILKLFHPIGLSSFVFLILIAVSKELIPLKLAWIAIVLSCTVIIPLTVNYCQRERFPDEQSQHFVPLLAGILCYTFGFLFLSALNAPALIQGLMFCYVVNSLVITGISAWWKVSVHITQISSALITLCVQWGEGMLPFLLLIPIVGVATVLLQKNTTTQVCVGALIGLAGTTLQLQAVFHQGFFF